MKYVHTSSTFACPVCDRTHDADCRAAELSTIVYCHTFQAEHKGTQKNGYTFAHKTDKGAGWGVWFRESKIKQDRKPEKQQVFLYPNRNGENHIRVHRQKGNALEFWQSYWIDNEWLTPSQAEKKGKGDVVKKMRAEVPIYRYQSVQRAIAQGKPIFWVEGESVADALWELDIAATTSIGGSGAYRTWGDYKTDVADATLIICPDRDKPGMKYAEMLAEDHPQAKWLYAFPDSPWWNRELPNSEGLDLKDWISEGATKDQLLTAVEPRRIGAVKEKKRCKMIANRDLCADIFGDDLRENLLRSEIEYKGEYVHSGRYRLFIGEHCNIDVTEQDALIIMGSLAEANSYHPVKDWLEKVHAEYGASTIELLDNPASRLLGTTKPIYDVYLRNQLIAAVARIYEPGCQVDYATILQGKQGYRKSSFWRVLAGDEWFDDTVGTDVEKPDELAKLNQTWFEELQEFDRITNKKEAAIVKSYVSRRKDSYRKPYDRSVEKHPRRNVLVGSVNPSEFLVDETGNRRFQVIPITQKIDTDYLASIRPQLWAAALELYRRGVKWYLTDEQEKASEEENKAFDIEDIWTLPVLEYLANESNHAMKDGVGYVMPYHILNYLNVPPAGQDLKAKRRLSSILKKAGWEPTPNTIRFAGLKSPVRAWFKPEEDVTVEETVTQTVTPTVTDSNPYISTPFIKCNGSNGSSIGVEKSRVTSKEEDVCISSGATVSTVTPLHIDSNVDSVSDTACNSIVSDAVTLQVSNQTVTLKPGSRVLYVGEVATLKALCGRKVLTIQSVEGEAAIVKASGWVVTQTVLLNELKETKR